MAIFLTACSVTGVQNTIEINETNGQRAVLMPNTDDILIALKQGSLSSAAEDKLFTILKVDTPSFENFINTGTVTTQVNNTYMNTVYNDFQEYGIRLIPTAGKTIAIKGISHHIVAAIAENGKSLFEFVYNNSFSLLKIHVYTSTTTIPGVSNYIEITEGILLRVHRQSGMYTLTSYNQNTYSLFHVESLIKSTNSGSIVKTTDLNNIMKFASKNSEIYIGTTPFVLEDSVLTLLTNKSNIDSLFTDNLSKTLMFQNINPVTYIIKSGQCLYTADSETVYCLNIDGSIIWTNNAAWMADIGTITALSISTDMLIVTGTLGLAFFALNGIFLCRYSYNSVTGETGAYQNEVTSLL